MVNNRGNSKYNSFRNQGGRRATTTSSANVVSSKKENNLHTVKEKAGDALKKNSTSSLKKEDKKSRTNVKKNVVTAKVDPTKKPETNKTNSFEKITKAEQERQFFNAFKQNTPYYEGVFNRVTDAMNNYTYSDDPEKMSRAMLNWFNEAYTEKTIIDKSTGKKVTQTYLKATAPPPPLGRNEKGEVIDITEDWEAFVMYQQVNADAVIGAVKKANKTWEHVAGVSTEKIDSPLDVFRSVVRGDSTLWDGVTKYVTDYFLNPLASGEWGTLGLNALVSIGETSDFFAGGIRAMLAAKPYIYGTQNTFEGQEAFIYSGGEALQTHLIALGAVELMHMEKYPIATESAGSIGEKKAIIQKLKNAGLYEEYLKFVKEWDSFEGSQTYGSNFRAFYTQYDKNFYADTGNSLGDFILELVTDPTLVVGALGQAVSKAGTKAAVKGAFKKAALEVNDELEDQVVRVLQRRIGKKIFSLSSDSLNKYVDDVLKAYKFPDGFDVKTFSDTLRRSIYDYRDSATFQVIKGFYGLERLTDMVDTALLRVSTFGGTLVVQKGLKCIKASVDPVRKAKLHKATQAAADTFEAMKRSDNKYNPAKLDAWVTMDNMRNGTHSSTIARDVRRMSNQFKAEMLKLDLIVREAVSKKSSVDELVNEVNKYIQKITDNKISTYVEFKGYLNDTLMKNFDKFHGEIQHILNAFSSEIDQIDNYITDLRRIHSNEELKKAKKITKESPTAKINYTEFSHKNKNPYSAVVQNAEDIETFYGEKSVLIHPSITSSIEDELDDLEAILPNNTDSKDVNFIKDFIAQARKRDLNIFTLDDKIREAIRDTQLNNVLNKPTEVNSEIVRKLIGLHEYLDDRTQLFLTKGVEIIRTQLDKALIWDRCMTDQRMVSVVSELMDIFSVIDEGSISLGSNFNKVAASLTKMRQNLFQLASFNNFSFRIKDKVSDIQYYSLLQTLFGISEANPGKCFIRNSSNIEGVINKVETTLFSQYGRESLSLDGFRMQALNFKSDFYKRFGDEVNDPVIRQRIKDICKAGHEDPLDDVNVQMLQVILKSPDAITLYNKESAIRDVFFLDIETTGLNRDACQISSIATKKWEPLKEDATLSEILNALENNASAKSYSVRRPQAELAEEVTDALLESIYKANPHVAVNERRTAYYKKYASEYANGVVKTEQEVIEAFMHDMDTSWGEHLQQLPKVVVHNNNGFDTAFIIARAGSTKTYFSSFKDMSMFADYTLNSMTHLKEYTQEGVSFTYEQKQAIIDAFVPFAKDMRRCGNDTRFLDPLGLANALDEMCEAFAELEEKGNLDMIRASITGKENLRATPLQSAVKKLVSLYDDNVFKDKRDILRAFLQDLRYERGGLANDIITNPFKSSTVNPGINNLLKTMMRLNPDVPFSPMGYNKIIDTDAVSKYFDGYLNDRVSYRHVVNLQRFTESIDNDLLNSVKSNSIVAKYYNDYVGFIEWAKSFAETLDDLAEFKYYTYLKTPNTPMEAFLIARKMWDDVFREVLKASSRKQTEATLYKIALKNQDKVAKEVNDILSPEALAVLSNSFGTDTLIFKHAVSDYYTQKFFNDDVIKSIEHSKIVEQCRRVGNSMENIGLIHNFTGNAKVKQYRIQDVNQYFISLLADIQRAFESASTFAVYEKYIHAADDLMRVNATKQIIGNMLEADNFEYAVTSHLLFNNHSFVLPLSDVDYVDKFVRKMMDSNFERVGYQIEDRYLFVYLNSKAFPYVLNDAATATEEVTMMLKGDTTVYKAPVYNKIDYPDLNTVLAKVPKGKADMVLLQSILDGIRLIDSKIDVLTNNKAVGSVGGAYTYTKHNRYLDSLPESVKKDMIFRDTTCDSRLWHEASFDRVILGGKADHWRISNWEESDMVKNLQHTLNEVAGQHAATVGYLDDFFGEASTSRLSYMFSGFTSEESFNAIKHNEDFAVVICKESAHTDSGFEVLELELKNAKEFEFAKNNNAVYVPYDVFLDMRNIFNSGTISNTFLKVWARTSAFTKIGQLFKPATAARNLLDGFIKAAGDVGSVSETAMHFCEAIGLISDYAKVSKLIGKHNKIGYYSEGYVRTLFSTVPQIREVMDYETYSFLSGLFQEGPMGGVSRQTIDNIAAANRANLINTGLRQIPSNTPKKRVAKEAYDMIGSTFIRFQDLGETEIRKLVDANKELFETQKGTSLTPETFIAYTQGLCELDGEEYAQASQIMSELILYRGKRNQPFGVKANSVIDKFANKALSLNSYAEGVIRLGEYLALEKQGYTSNEIFKKITKSQFDYDIKNRRVKALETIIPYLTFELNNTSYWIRQVSENPKLLRYLEAIWGEFVYDAAYERYDEDTPTNNASLQHMVLHGNVPVGMSGMFLKTDLSIFSAFEYAYGGPSVIFDKIATPIQYLARHSLKAVGADHWNILNSLDFDFSDEPLMEQIGRSLPGISIKYNVWDEGYALHREDRLSGDADVPRLLVAKDPFLFGAIARYHSDQIEIMEECLAPYIEDGTLTEEELSQVKWDSFIANLEKQGKWYDKNWGKIVDISQKNTIGLNGDFDFENNPEDWERYCYYQKIYKGKHWDYNQRKFVPMAEFIPGMLNREFDFKNDKTAWEDFCYYNEELFGTKWDNNQQKFVSPDCYIEGGLNSDQLSFSELCILKYAIHGMSWDRDAGKFVKTHEPLVIFDIDENKDIDTSTITIRQKDNTNLVKNLFESFMANTVAYGATLNQVPRVAPTLQNRKYVFTKDLVNNANVILAILANVKVPGIDYAKDYKTGSAGGYIYKAKDYVKELPAHTRAAIAAKYGKSYYNYGIPFLGVNGRMSLRLATTGKLEYEHYYQQNYNYNYQYKNPVTGTANYPQTKLGIQRYEEMRQDRLIKKLQSRTPMTTQKTTKDSRFSVKTNIYKSKLSWWNRY